MTNQPQYVLELFDLNNPLTIINPAEDPSHESIQTTPLGLGTEISIGRPTNKNYPDIPLENSNDISRKQGLICVLGKTEDGKPILTYRDAGKNRPLATLSGYHADLRQTRLAQGKQIRLHPGESLTFGKYNNYTLEFTEARKTQNYSESPFLDD